jgi:hypothetical protein
MNEVLNFVRPSTQETILRGKTIQMKKMIPNIIVALLAIVLVSATAANAQSPVKVINLKSEPIPVVNINDAGQPFNETSLIIHPPGTNVSQVDVATVPEGKRLVIEFISFSSEVPTGQRVVFFSLSTNIGTGNVNFTLPVNTQPAAADGDPIFRTAQSLRIYADGGTTVKASFGRSASTGNAACNIYISGYLIDIH